MEKEDDDSVLPTPPAASAVAFADDYDDGQSTISKTGGSIADSSKLKVYSIIISCASHDHLKMVDNSISFCVMIYLFKLSIHSQILKLQPRSVVRMSFLLQIPKV